MKLIFGCGYLGRRVAMRWREQGDQVCAITRSPTTAGKLREEGLTAIVADVTDPASLRDLPPAETVLYAIGYDRAAGIAMRDVYVDGLRNACAAIKLSGKFLYISSTGVYGDFHGEWIDESAPCLPDREGGRVCLAAEELLQSHPLGQQAVILRLAGIYGPGRIPRREALAAGEPIAAPEQGWLNLIHVDDAVNIILAAEEQANAPSLWHVSDGQPVARGDYFRELARLVAAQPPRFITATSDSPVSQRAASDKRIDNRRLRADLRFSLAYPSYREGLAAIVAQ